MFWPDCFEEDFIAGHAFLEEQIAVNNQDATKMKIEGLMNGRWGYEVNPAHAFISARIAAGDRYVIMEEIKRLQRQGEIAEAVALVRRYKVISLFS